MIERNDSKIQFARFLDALFKHAHVLNCVNQQDVAEILGIDPANLSRYLSGVISPSSAIVGQLLCVFLEPQILGKDFILEHFDRFLSSL